MLAGLIAFEFGQFTEAQSYLELSVELARKMSAGNFEANALVVLAALNAAQGRIQQARDFSVRAVKVVREVGMTFVGPNVLAIKAALTDDRDECRKALEEAESILNAGCVAHNHFWFARISIDHALAVGDWDEAERYAARLETYTREQPLPWSDFLIARGRALASWGRGRHGEDVVVEMTRLHELAVRQGLKPLDLELERALASA
jgi:ATP/maltotriose-dependent transcriptional regulator MalT